MRRGASIFPPRMAATAGKSFSRGVQATGRRGEGIDRLIYGVYYDRDTT